LLTEEERKQILPRKMVGRLSKMDHFNAQRFLNGPEVEQSAQYLRPGTEVPNDWAYSGESQRGTYHGNANVADQFNNLISKGMNSEVPILHQASQFARGASALRLAVSPVHYVIEAGRSLGLAVGRAAEAAVGGHFSLAAKNLALMNPLPKFKSGAYELGKAAREQYADPNAHPHLEQDVQNATLGGQKFNMESVLDKNHFNDAKAEWAEGNKVGAAGRFAQGVFEKTHAFLFKQYIPNLKMYHAIAMEVGTKDGLLASNKELEQTFTKFGVQHTYEEYDGDHTNKRRLVGQSVNLPARLVQGTR
jgi:hypothetical protein